MGAILCHPQCIVSYTILKANDIPIFLQEQLKIEEEGAKLAELEEAQHQVSLQLESDGATGNAEELETKLFVQTEAVEAQRRVYEDLEFQQLEVDGTTSTYEVASYFFMQKHWYFCDLCDNWYSQWFVEYWVPSYCFNSLWPSDAKLFSRTKSLLETQHGNFDL